MLRNLKQVLHSPEKWLIAALPTKLGRTIVEDTAPNVAQEFRDVGRGAKVAGAWALLKDKSPDAVGSEKTALFDKYIKTMTEWTDSSLISYASKLEAYSLDNDIEGFRQYALSELEDCLTTQPQQSAMP